MGVQFGARRGNTCLRDATKSSLNGRTTISSLSRFMRKCDQWICERENLIRTAAISHSPTPTLHCTLRMPPQNSCLSHTDSLDAKMCAYSPVSEVSRTGVSHFTHHPRTVLHNGWSHPEDLLTAVSRTVLGKVLQNDLLTLRPRGCLGILDAKRVEHARERCTRPNLLGPLCRVRRAADFVEAGTHIAHVEKRAGISSVDFVVSIAANFCDIPHLVEFQTRLTSVFVSYDVIIRNSIKAKHLHTHETVPVGELVSPPGNESGSGSCRGTWHCWLLC